MNSGFLNNLLASFTQAFQTYQSDILLVGVSLLSVLTFLQFLYIAVEIGSTRDIRHIFQSFSVALIKLLIPYAIMDRCYEWANAIKDVGPTIAQQVTHQSPTVLTPSGVLDQGWMQVQLLLQVAASNEYLHPIQNLEWVAGEITISFAWIYAAIMFLLLLLEAAIAVSVGPIFVGMSAFEGTGEALYGWAKLLVTITINIALVMLVLAAGTVIVSGWVAELHKHSDSLFDDMGAFAVTVAQSLLFYHVLKNITKIGQSAIGGAGGAFAGAVLNGIAGSIAAAGSFATGALGGPVAGTAARQIASSGQSDSQSQNQEQQSDPPAQESELTQEDREILGIDSSAQTASMASEAATE